MKVAIIGYGRMGHEVEAIALDRGHEVVLKIDQNNKHLLSKRYLSVVDVAIEFSTPETAFENVKACLLAGVPVVCGTTGWIDHLNEAKELTRKLDGTLFVASNFSIGVNLFFQITRILSQQLNGIGGYDAYVEEIHHNKKKDAPSGTAISLATIISEEMKSFNGWTLLPQKSDDKIPIKSIREGDVPGTHNVHFNSEQDEIILTHIAKNRKGFALGAVLAAEFSVGKKGILTMDSFLKM